MKTYLIAKFVQIKLFAKLNTCLEQFLVVWAIQDLRNSLTHKLTHSQTLLKFSDYTLGELLYRYNLVYPWISH